jgi:hypothetical protein
VGRKFVGNNQQQMQVQENAEVGWSWSKKADDDYQLLCGKGG